MQITGKSYKDLWQAIIRPPRDIYSISDLGPQKLVCQGQFIQRTDLTIKNKRGLTLQCSWFEPIERVAQQLPCVVYLHGNSSSRMEALSCINILLPSNISLFCFDFSGCGLSEGDYISLGYFEKDDVDIIIEYLRKSNKVSTIGLWGRSMGAATALMHAERDPSIGGMVIDSAFTSLHKVAEDLCKMYTKIPNFIVSGALKILSSTIKSKAKFEISKLKPIDHVDKDFIPTMFIAGKDDNFIKCEHTKQLYDKYSGDKNIHIVDGEHNSRRPEYILDSIGIFFYNTLLCSSLPQQSTKNQAKFDNISELQQNIWKHQQQQQQQQNFEEDDEDEKQFDLMVKQATENSLKDFKSSEINNQQEEKKDSDSFAQQINDIKINQDQDLLNLDEFNIEESDSEKKQNCNVNKNPNSLINNLANIQLKDKNNT